MSKNKNKKAEKSPVAQSEFLFTKENYKWMVIGIAVIILGYLLMVGSENIYDFRKTTLAPIVIIAGIVIEIYAIMKSPKPADSNSENNG